jgi:hypothetical protein
MAGRDQPGTGPPQGDTSHPSTITAWPLHPELPAMLHAKVGTLVSKDVQAPGEPLL